MKKIEFSKNTNDSHNDCPMVELWGNYFNYNLFLDNDNKQTI